MDGSNRRRYAYLYFYRASGRLRQRLSGLPDVTSHLVYSADGSLLIAAVGGKNGNRVFDAAHGYKPLPSDIEYGDDSYWADFDRQGNLVTTSYDGFVRLYASGRYGAPIAKIKPPQISRPFSALFSPNGEQIAVGDDASTSVVVLSGKDLAFIRAADTAGISGPEISSVAWSADGRYLFAGGWGNNFRVRRWENAGAGKHIDIDASNNTV